MTDNFFSDDLLYDWAPEKMIEIKLKEPDDFLKIRETLSRIGVASKKDMKLFQTCNILHKRGKYYIVHFKEIFAIEGKDHSLTLSDVARRNKIASLVQEWGLCEVVNKEMIKNQAQMASIKVVPYKERNDWTFICKYKLGKK